MKVGMFKTACEQGALRTFVAVSLLVLAYLVIGRLALLLAIPPGFATAIFPPVGVALAAVLIWGYPLLLGVYLGSTILNLTIAVSSLAELNSSNLVVASGIALGTTLQCGIASYLIRRFVGFPNALVDEYAILKTLLIGGPLTCLISAGFGPLVLYYAGLTEHHQLAFSMWTWWIGDSIGVLIAAPLMFIFFAQPRDIWRLRIATVGMPLVTATAIVVVVFLQTSHAEQSAQRLSFKEEASLAALKLEYRFLQYEQVVSFMERYHNSETDIDTIRFRQFVSPILKDFPGIKALTWNVYVPHEQRLDFEREQQSIHTDFAIRALGPDGSLHYSPKQDFYAPITLIEPIALNYQFLGYNPLSDINRRNTFISAIKANSAKISPLVALVQNPKQSGFLLVKAVHKDYDKSLLTGFVVLVIDPSEIVDYSFGGITRSDYRVQVFDVTNPVPVTIYKDVKSKETSYSSSFAFVKSFEFSGRKLKLEILPSEAYLKSHKSMQSWTVLAGGLLLSAMLGGFLLILSGRAELVRQQVRKQTMELRAILDNAADAILIITDKGKIELANPAAQKLFCGSQTEIVKVHALNILPVLKSFELKVLESGFEKNIECFGFTLTGESLELELGLSHYYLENRNRYICLLRNISVRKQVERLKSEFLATVSHELRTPLTSIKGTLELIKVGVVGEVSKECNELINISLQNADRLNVLINDILDVEKLKSGQVGLDLTDHLLVPFLHESIINCQGYAEKYKVNLSLNVQDLAPDTLVKIDKLRLHQVMANLLSNAIKFSPSGEEVRVVVETHGHEVRINVIDRGQGIPESFRNKVFQRFSQVDSSDRRQSGGAGLGLSICKTLIERMSGRVDFVSTVGKGSTFFIELPIVVLHAKP
jgi:PAS domain S-box-containing protein